MMKANILTKVSSRVGNLLMSSSAAEKSIGFYNRLMDAVQAFKFTFEQGRDPLLSGDSLLSRDNIDRGLDNEANRETSAIGPTLTAMLPRTLAHFSDGTPLTLASLSAWKHLSTQQKVERNDRRLQASVVRWDTLAKSTLLPNPQYPGLSAHHFIFMHIPKAGGTTLQHILAKTYLPNRFIHANGPEIERNPGVIFNVRRTEPRSVIMGHFDRSGLVYELLSDRPIIHFTMLRDPVKRVLSHYQYIKARPGHRQHEQVKDLSLEAYAATSLREIQNKQTLRILGDSSHEAFQQSLQDPEPLLEAAKQVLAQQFTLFGLTERYTEFLIMAKRMLGWNEIVYLRKNVSSDNKRDPITEPAPVSDEALERIRNRNQLDIQLYEFANELFSQRCQTLGIEAAAIEQYTQLSQTYQSVLTGLEAL